MLSEQTEPMLAEQTDHKNPEKEWNEKPLLLEEPEPMLSEQISEQEEPKKPRRPKIPEWNDLITEAIMNSESQALTLDAICQYIKEAYPYFDSKGYKRSHGYKFRLEVQHKLCEGILFCQVSSSDSLIWAMKDDKEALNPHTKGPSTTSTYSVNKGIYSCNQCDMKTPSAHK